MIVIARTDTYTIYKKRNQRYAVKKNATREWLHGGDKVAVLLAHNLVPTPTVRAPEHPEAPAAEASAVRAGETPAEPSAEPGAGGDAPE
jgi:hypothetical protein